MKKNWKPYTAIDNRQTGHMGGIWYRKVYHDYNEKPRMTNDGRNRTTKSRKYLNARRKSNLQIIENIRRGHQQTSKDEKKNQKIISHKNE